MLGIYTKIDSAAAAIGDCWPSVFHRKVRDKCMCTQCRGNGVLSAIECDGVCVCVCQLGAS